MIKKMEKMTKNTNKNVFFFYPEESALMILKGNPNNQKTNDKTIEKTDIRIVRTIFRKPGT